MQIGSAPEPHLWPEPLVSVDVDGETGEIQVGGTAGAAGTVPGAQVLSSPAQPGGVIIPPRAAYSRRAFLTGGSFPSPLRSRRSLTGQAAAWTRCSSGSTRCVVYKSLKLC